MNSMIGWFDAPEEGVEHVRCGLRIEGPRAALNPEEAWALLPASGEGWVALTDEVRRFEPGRCEGIPLHAEVADGNRTVVLRHDCGVWRAWVWHEIEGDDHRVVRRNYCSSAPPTGGGDPEMCYATYWKKRDGDGIGVWSPVGSRFCGWKD